MCQMLGNAGNQKAQELIDGVRRQIASAGGSMSGDGEKLELVCLLGEPGIGKLISLLIDTAALSLPFRFPDP